MNALVSIITPAYNSAKFIAETIQSVQNQTHQNWEMIIVDDGSSDETEHIVLSIIENDKRIQFHKLSQNSGPAVARNTGIEKASGDFMTFIDADDIWFPTFIENNIKTIQETGIPFVFSSYRRCLTAFLDIKKLGKKYMPLIRKRQDMGLWLNYLKVIPFAHGIQETQAIYRIRENSLSRKKSDLIKYQWQFYTEVEKLNVFQSAYYMLHWMYRGFMKYRN
jgi:glycosyltransferase involved in cell wall biosynthesis